MRSLLIASAGLALAGGGVADAQRMSGHGPGASYGAPGTAMQAPMANPGRPGPIATRPPLVQTSSQQVGGHRPRWGSKIGGRWWGGANAPGGWAGYRRPHRGWAVPPYWNAPRFYVSDWATYDLAQPPYGYNWARYYDDAVLIDSRGSVYDTTSGVDWDRYDNRSDGGGYAARYPETDSVYAGPSERGYAAPNDDHARYEDRGGPRRDNGLGGAAIGAVAGGVAGNVIAGRGNRLGGTLIGAGVGAAAGYAIDKNEDRGRRPSPPPPPPPRASGYDSQYDARYDSGHGAGYAYPPAPVYGRAQGGSWVSPDGVTTVTTSGGAYQGGSTTVVIQSAPVVTTTTTTEYYQDAVSYRPKKVWKKRTWRAKPACYCR